MKTTLLAIGVFCLSLFSACDSDRRTAQNEGYPEAGTTENIAIEDEVTEETSEFLTTAASGGMMEVELGQIAQEKATRQEVKDFANTMVQDHGQANERLKSVARNKNIQLPQQMNEEHQEKVQKFRDMAAGQEFDKEYVNLMVGDHEEDIRKFEEMQNEVQDPEIKQWVDNTLQTLRQHKQRIDQINGSMQN